MKPYSQYGQGMKSRLRYMYSVHPKPVRMHLEAEDTYAALQKEGWVQPIGRRSMTLTDKGAFKMAEVSRLL